MGDPSNALSFYDPKKKIGVTKADYVLWLYRLMDLMDTRDISMFTDELQADKSRMGKWYYGEVRKVFGALGVFRKFESPHKRLHALGLKAYEAARRGDRKSVKTCILG
ncbi:MAG: CZB domain-containing protein [Candidatus Brocadia sp.]